MDFAKSPQGVSTFQAFFALWRYNFGFFFLYFLLSKHGTAAKSGGLQPAYFSNQIWLKMMSVVASLSVEMYILEGMKTETLPEHFSCLRKCV